MHNQFPYAFRNSGKSVFIDPNEANEHPSPANTAATRRVHPVLWSRERYIDNLGLNITAEEITHHYKIVP
jgi:hypothetical protein